MKTFAFFLLIMCFSMNSFGQKFAVPDSILSDLESTQFEYTFTAEFKYKVVYPVNYDSSKKYNVLLGLSGGNSNEQIVNFCYYTLFDSKYFDDYITILPLGPLGRSLADIDSTEINLLIEDVMKNHNVTDKNWIVAGTSMGGFAAFNFAFVRPELFDGIITFPGGLRTDNISEEWSNYKILLAVGEFDEKDWTSLNEETEAKLKGKVKSVETLILEGQEHIISPEYDIDTVYSKYFNK